MRDTQTWVRFHLRIEDGTVRDARFQALGCPITLAVMAWLTGRLPGARYPGLNWARLPSGPKRSLYRWRNLAGCSWSKMRCKRVL